MRRQKQEKKMQEKKNAAQKRQYQQDTYILIFRNKCFQQRVLVVGMFIICRRTKSKQFSSVCQIKTGLSIQIGFFSPPTPLISHFLSLQSVIFRHFLSRLLLSNKRGCHLSPIHPKWNWLVEVQQAQLTLITTITFSVMLTCLFNPYLFVSVPVCPNIVTCETDSLRVKALQLFILN